jgi:DNA repair protein RadC
MTHDKHRQRLRERFLNSPDSFEDHELLELILFYSIPRKNTNETAHRLIERFGSVRGILDASIDALVKVDDIGMNTALYIKAIAKLVSKYSISEQKSDGILKSPAALSTFLKNLFIGTQNEISYILLFDNSKRLITCEKIGEGFSMEHTLSLRKAVLSALTSNATSAILVHNHPNGKAFPSGDDIHATNKAKMLLESLGVVLMEHFIVADDECRPIINTQRADIFNER